MKEHNGVLVGIVGQARTGKDTFAEFLAEALFDKLHKKFILMAYAHEIKLRIQRDFDLSYEQLWGDKKEVIDERYERKIPYSEQTYWTPREILQEYGEFLKTIDNSFWVSHLFRVIEEKEFENIIVTDVRFPVEATAVSDRGGFLVKINRSNKEEVHGANHSSEMSMEGYDNIDFHVENNGTKGDLRNTAKQVVEMLTAFYKTKKNLEGY